jgi:hypothetical protein
MANQIYKQHVIERLESITKATISNHVLFTKRGDKYTVKFYNCDDCKYYKATVQYNCLIGNIREAK